MIVFRILTPNAPKTATAATALLLIISANVVNIGSTAPETVLTKSSKVLDKTINGLDIASTSPKFLFS